MKAALVIEMINKALTGCIPVRHYSGDCGHDLFVAAHTVIPPGEFRDVSTNVRCELPYGTWGLIIGRSSTFRKRRLLVIPGIIDNGYRGELFTAVFNMNGSDAVLDAGDRLAQLIIMPLVTPRIEVGEVNDSDRGDKGFGSTGK